jgi:hypothetical protein
MDSWFVRFAIITGRRVQGPTERQTGRTKGIANQNSSVGVISRLLVDNMLGRIHFRVI